MLCRMSILDANFTQILIHKEKDKPMEEKSMNMYEVILNILEKKGPSSIPSICQEMNQEPYYHIFNKEKPILPAQIKSVISRKTDLFNIQDDLVFIHSDKVVQRLTVSISGNQNPCYTIRVDFNKNRFYFFEWRLEKKSMSKSKKHFPMVAGDMDAFKKELYRIKLWDWKPDYQNEGIILDGMCWSVKLETRSKNYESKGLECFPDNWKKFCRALKNLVGINLA